MHNTLCVTLTLCWFEPRYLVSILGISSLRLLPGTHQCRNELMLATPSSPPLSLLAAIVVGVDCIIYYVRVFLKWHVSRHVDWLHWNGSSLSLSQLNQECVVLFLFVPNLDKNTKSKICLRAWERRIVHICFVSI